MRGELPGTKPRTAKPMAHSTKMMLLGVVLYAGVYYYVNHGSSLPPWVPRLTSPLAGLATITRIPWALFAGALVSCA